MNGSFTEVSEPAGLSAYDKSDTTIYKLLQLPVEYVHTSKSRSISDDALKIMSEK